ncbi:hypothetical protein F0U44_11010 [Nocardioides humilatus]|uniref:Uncharacterized protein n=1 Tax=Nocardioides humilatus TaxID=2607660 RepID=A0A5B1LH84_9ACTN|nr:hypothetical protein [Nocardioides humilatus]KAA1418987.1 hypothetical protein F0U44_11010 [Nocardioides humilatus]
MEARSESRLEQKTPYVGIAVTFVCALVIGMGLAWAFLAMRAVAGVGGSCGSSNTYAVVTPCPDGSWLIAIAIPAMLIAMFVGAGVGSSIGAPALILPLWALLFTSLGWNFLEFGFGGDVNVGFIVCGIMFWGMAAPAWVAIWVAFRKEGRTTSLWWWLTDAVLLAVGAFLGVAVYALASA